MLLLPIALPLTHLDLRNFSFVTDDAILALAAATNLQVLYLAGTKLTDVGSAVFTHLSCLKELELDRTSIGDKSMEYLRGNGILSFRSRIFESLVPPVAKGALID